MAQYDGAIRIATKITTKDATESLASLEWQIKKSAKYMDELRSKMDALKDQKIPTNEYQKMQNELAKAEKSLSDLIKEQSEMESLGITSGGTWDTLNEKVATASDKVDAIKEKMQELVDTGKGFTLGKDTAQYAAMEQQLQYEEESVRQAAKHYQQLMQQTPEIQKQAAEEQRLAEIRENAVAGNQRIIETVERIKQLEQEIADLKAAGVTEGYQDYDSRVQELSELKQEIKDYNNGIDETKQRYRQLSSSAANALKQIGKSISRYAIAPFKLLGNIAKKAFSNIGKGSKSSNGVLNGGLKTILKYGLGIRSLYAAFNKLRTAIKEGFTNLYNDKNITGFKNSVDSLRASILTLKNSFAAAFRPIVETAIPYIQRLTDHMVQLLEVVGKFMAAITGQKAYTKAIKQTTAAIEDQNKAQNKQLSGLDKLNNLSSRSESTNDSGAAGAMFEELPLDDKFKNISQWLKDMWESADFSDLGELIGKKIKSALDSIPWENIKKSARKIGSSIATLINGGIDVPGLGYSIGNTLAQAINTGFENLNAFVHDLHWDSVGTFIADSLNELFGNVDWDLIKDTFVTGAKGLATGINSFISDFNWDNLSDTISGAVNTISESIHEFLSTVNWEELGYEVGDQLTKTMEKIDWEKVGNAIGDVIQLALDFVKGLADGFEFEEAAQAIIDVLGGFFDTVNVGQLASTILALLAAEIAIKATVSLFTSAATAILNALGRAIISSASALSGIASSILTGIGTAFTSLGGLGGILTADLSTIFGTGAAAEIGVTIGTGILAGIAAAFAGGAIAKLLNNYVLGPIISFFDEDLGNYYKNFKWFGEGGFFDMSIDEAWRGLIEWAKDSNSQLGILIKTKERLEESGFELAGWAEYSSGILGSLDNITQWNGFSEWFNNKISPWFTKEKWTELFQNIKNSAVVKWNEIKDWWDRNVSPWMKKAWEILKDAAKSPINGIIGMFETLVNGIVKAVNTIITALNGLSFDIPDWVPGIGGKSFKGFNIPKLNQVSIPRLATGTVVPPNREFMAVLGDNKREHEVVSPISTIEEAVENVLRRNGGVSNEKEINLNLTVECEGYQLIHILQKLNKEYSKQNGGKSILA